MRDKLVVDSYLALSILHTYSLCEWVSE